MVLCDRVGKVFPTPGKYRGKNRYLPSWEKLSFSHPWEKLGKTSSSK